MNSERWKFGGLRVSRICASPSAPIAYVFGDAKACDCSGWTVVCVEELDWNRDLTPWPAKSVFRGQPDFGGGAAQTLRRLTDEIMPTVEADLQPTNRIIAGYSLAGLFAVYAALETELFQAAASVSGSMWYPGFADYVGRKERVPKFVYFSVGDRERFGRNAAFHSIEDCTQRICTHLAARGAETVFEFNPGGHFCDVDARMRRAFGWLDSDLNQRSFSEDRS